MKGRDVVLGLPRTVRVEADEIRRALEEPVQAIVDAVRTALEQTPPELSADIVMGIVIAGGGASLEGSIGACRVKPGCLLLFPTTPSQLW